MAPAGYVNCSCCGRLYRADGSEDDLYNKDHKYYDAVVLTTDCLNCHGSGRAPGDGRTACGFCAPTPQAVRKANNRRGVV